MPISAYEELHDETWTRLIQETFAKELSQLKLMRFTEMYFIRETGQPFSLFPLLAQVVVSYVLGRGNPVPILRVGDGLSAVSYRPYVVHPDGFAYGVISDNRIRFVTMIDDGTLLHTMNHRSTARHNEQYRFITQYSLTENGYNGTFKDTWRMHIQRVERLAKIRAVIAPLRVSDMIRMEMRADQIIAGETPESWETITRKKDND
jgi:hypothetical protein